MQEAITWSLIDQSNFALTLEDSHNSISPYNPPYPNYLTCLVGQKAMEIPVQYNSDTIMLALTDTLAYSTPLATSVRKLRHMVRWRDCWVQETWRFLVGQAVQTYATAISKCSTSAEAKSLLSEREMQCKKLIDAMNIGTEVVPDANQAIFQATVLADKGSLPMAESILMRVIEHDPTSTLESLSAYRLLAKIHLVHGRIDKSVAMSEKVLSFCQAGGADYLIAATCAFNAGDFVNATKHIEQACTLGVPFSETRKIAVRIAGQTGDAQLLERIRGEND